MNAMHNHFSRNIACCCILLAIAGCGGTEAEPPPPTFVVTGRVLDRDGQPLTGGIIQFVSKRDGTLNMSSIINPDGTFELTTIAGNENLAGAIEGPCQVMVTLPIVGGQPPEIIILPKEYEIGTSTNEFEIRLATMYKIVR